MASITTRTRTDRLAPRGGSLREAQKQLTYRRLLDAALEVFAADGYGSARVEDVAARAGASRATFYLHFSGKSDLAQSLVDEHAPAEAAIWAELPSGNANVRPWLARLTELWDEEPSYFLVLEQAISADPAVAVRYAAQRRERIELLANRRLGRPAEGVLDARALLLVAQLERFCHLWLVREPGVDWEATLDELATSWSQAS